MKRLPDKPLFVPTFKDKDGNHFFILRESLICNTHEDAAACFPESLLYIPFGFTWQGVKELKVKGTRAIIEHKIAEHPCGSLVVFNGPLFTQSS